MANKKNLKMQDSVPGNFIDCIKLKVVSRTEKSKKTSSGSSMIRAQVTDGLLYRQVIGFGFKDDEADKLEV